MQPPAPPTHSPPPSLTASIDTLEWTLHEHPVFGHSALPSLPWWAAHRYLMRLEGLEFDPDLFRFDAIVARESGLKALQEPADPTDAEALHLQRNLAVLRNVLMGYVLPRNQTRAQERLEQMALHVAAMLKRGTSGSANWRGALSFPGSVALPYTEATRSRHGAGVIYHSLRRLSGSPGLARKLLIATGLCPRLQWDLPPPQATPFTPQHLHAVLLEEEDLQNPKVWEDMILPEALLLAEQEEALEAGIPVEEIGIEEQFYQAVETLSHNIKRQAVDIAHEILRKLKMQLKDVPMDALLAHDPALLKDCFPDMDKLFQIYDAYLGMAVQQKPELMEDDLIMEANHAIGQMLFQAKQFALKQAVAEKNLPLIAGLQKEMEAFPESMRTPSKDSVNKVLGKVEKALDKVLGVLQAASVEAPGENERMRAESRGKELADQEMRLAQLVGMGEEMQRLQATQQAAQRNAQQQAHQNTQQQVRSRQQQQQERQGGRQRTTQEMRRVQQQQRVTRTQANIMRQQRVQRQMRLQQRLQQQHVHAKFEHLLDAGDMDVMRSGIHAPTTGEAIESGSAKETIRRELQRRDKGMTVAAPSTGQQHHSVVEEASPAAQEQTAAGSIEGAPIPPPRPPKRKQTGR